MAVAGNLCEGPFSNALERLMAVGDGELDGEAFILVKQIQNFLCDLKRKEFVDLLPKTVANAKSSIFNPNPSAAFLTNVSINYPLNDLPSVHPVDHFSVIYQFQLKRAKEAAALAAYFHPLDTPEIVFFWIGRAFEVDSESGALPWLDDANFSWKTLSTAYDNWLGLANTALSALDNPPDGA